MKKKIKILLALFLAIMAIFAFCACGEGEEDDEPQGTVIDYEKDFILDYRLSENGEYYIVEGYGLSFDEHVVIASEYKGKPVREIADSAFKASRAQENIISVTIPDSITKIGQYAFADCKKLQTVNFGNGVKTIETYAFYGCESLLAVEMPNSVQTIGRQAFSGCTALSKVTISESLTSIGKGAFASCPKILGKNAIGLEGVYYVSTKTGSKSWVIGASTDVVNANLPDNAVGIADGAFNAHKKLETVEIPAGILYIGEDAFNNCTAIKTVYYGGYETSWGMFSVGANNTYLLTATIQFAK